jgi:hypothetical protein
MVITVVQMIDTMKGIMLISWLDVNVINT